MEKKKAEIQLNPHKDTEHLYTHVHPDENDYLPF